jgi:hypothetical protein
MTAENSTSRKPLKVILTLVVGYSLYKFGFWLLNETGVINWTPESIYESLPSLIAGDPEQRSLFEKLIVHPLEFFSFSDLIFLGICIFTASWLRKSQPKKSKEPTERN